MEHSGKNAGRKPEEKKLNTVEKTRREKNAGEKNLRRKSPEGKKPGEENAGEKKNREEKQAGVKKKRREKKTREKKKTRGKRQGARSVNPKVDHDELCMRHVWRQQDETINTWMVRNTLFMARYRRLSWGWVSTSLMNTRSVLVCAVSSSLVNVVLRSRAAIPQPTRGISHVP